MVFNPRYAKVAKRTLTFFFYEDLPLNEGDDHSEYVVIRFKDLDDQTKHKLSKLLQGKFSKTLGA